MANVYKSSSYLVLKNFVWILIIPLLLFAALSVASDAQEIMTVLYSMLISITLLAMYFVFHRNNITIEVTADTVKFSRHGTEFLNFDRKTHEFASHIIFHTDYGIRAGASRYLRVIPKDGGKYKNYKCHNFDEKTFEELIAAVSANPSGQQVKTEYYKEPLTFTINKNLMLEKYRKYKFISFGVVSAVLLCLAAIAFVIILFPSINISLKMYCIIAMLSILLPVISILRTVNLSKVKIQTPEKITIFKDKLEMDNADFYFSYLTQIKMTSPSYERDVLDNEIFQIPFRKMIVTGRNISYEFILDFLPQKNNPKIKSAFPEYGILFNELKELFANNENRFIAELE